MTADGKTTRRFKLREVFEIEVEIDADHLAEIMDHDDWGAMFYQFGSEEEAVAYVTRLLMLRHKDLNLWDGHANLEPGAARIVEVDMNDWDYGTSEVKK